MEKHSVVKGLALLVGTTLTLACGGMHTQQTDEELIPALSEGKTARIAVPAAFSDVMGAVCTDVCADPKADACKQCVEAACKEAAGDMAPMCDHLDEGLFDEGELREHRLALVGLAGANHRRIGSTAKD